jgi:hypothetical protein
VGVECGPAADFADALADRLDRKPMVDGVSVDGWRFEVGRWNALRAGLKDGQLGSPYESPAASEGISGGVYLRWSDGTSSSGSFDRRILEELPERLAEWRENALDDPDTSPILDPQPLPAVRTADSSVEAMVRSDPGPLIAWLKQVGSRLRQEGFSRVHADSGAGLTWRYVYNSRGLRVVYPETSVSLYLGAQELYSRSYGRRRWADDDEQAELLEDVVANARALSQPVEAPLGDLPVLLLPGLAMSLLGTFLVGNLVGGAAAAGRGAYSLDDFRLARQVMRPNLSLLIDTLLELEGAASPVSSEGVPGGQAVLVDRGRLARPIVDLKYAGRTGFAPTPVPAGGPAFLLRSDRPWLPLPVVRSELAIGLQLHSVLGLRSQDGSSGRYSLVAPQALVISEGRPAGRAKVSISGSFFDHLLDERTQLVELPYSLNPGLLIWSAVERQTV